MTLHDTSIIFSIRICLLM